VLLTRLPQHSCPLPAHGGRLLGTLIRVC